MTAAFRGARAALLVLSLAFSTTAQAAPIDYTITFAVVEGSGQTPTGSFTYDADAPGFSNFHLFWNGLDFDVTHSANDPGVAAGCGPKEFGPTIGFAILSGSTVCPAEQLWAGRASDVRVSLTLFASRQTFGPILRQESTLSVVDTLHIDGRSIPSAAGTFSIAETQMPTTVPEPTTMVLLGSGLAGLLLRRRGTS